MKVPALKKDDIVAGLTGAMAGTPQVMGFALIAGVNPIYGLYTAVVSTIIGAIFGNSTYMTVDPFADGLAIQSFADVDDMSGLVTL